MKIFFTLLSSLPKLEFSQGLVGWAGWFMLGGLLAVLLWNWKSYLKPWEKAQRWLFFLLLLLIPITVLFIGFKLPPGSALTPPLIPEDPTGPAIMIFSALPWVLAAGFFGPLPAASLAIISGFLRALWDTHSFFTPLEMALLATLFSVAINQRYRTPFFRLLRHPLPAAILFSLIYPLFSLFDTILTAQGLLVNRLDYALTHLGGATLAMGIELLVASLFAEVIAIAFPSLWGRNEPLKPSPPENSLQARFLYSMSPLALALILSLMVGDWLVAGNAARDMLRERMANAAEMAAKSLPYFLETGQSLISELALNPQLQNANPAQLDDLLSEDFHTIPFFRQLFILDTSGEMLASYPSADYISSQAPTEEQRGFKIALDGVPVQTYTIPPETGETSAQVTFIATITNSLGSVDRVLIGRSDLASNPFSQSVLTSINTLESVGGQGLLIDENDRIIYHSDPKMVMSSYTSRTPTDAVFYDGTAPDGTRRLVYYQPVVGHPWAVVLTVPASFTQQLALNIAAPLLAMIVLLSLLAMIVVSWVLRAVTGSLQNLSLEAGRISQGQLDHPLAVDGEDEVGRLRRSFEQMRISLKARLDELNRLLVVSQGVASSLDMSEAVKPILEAALATGASAARVVLTPAIMPDLDSDTPTQTSFGIGPARELYSDLDEQVLNLTRQQDRLILTNPSRPRMLSFTPGSPRPEALLAVALRHENTYYGTLWVVYDRAHLFIEEEVRFLATLAGQAALAAANSRLFLNAEIGRQRLAAILASTPDPVLVTDQHDRLLLANPAAWQVLGLGMDADDGKPIERVISEKELTRLLRSSSAEKQSSEVALPNGRTYLATATSVLAEGQRVGRICVLRDVTYFKELDALKSDFVSTVSHDLRSPLTLMRGYATMLEMVGELNEQQTNYVRKIVSGVESMSRLVNNLLDLGRIEAGIDLQLEMVLVRDIVEKVASALQLQATQKRIQLNIDIPQQTVPLIEADPALLQQALHNLVENAIKYTRAEGKVTIGAKARQDRMVFEVNDNGIGVSPMDQPRLFEKFYRGAQQGSKDQQGTGLGLAIVKSIVERHKGQVWVESQLGKGSTFFISLPIRQPKRVNEGAAIKKH
jgi:PAS domain S-box-containing protein